MKENRCSNLPALVVTHLLETKSKKNCRCLWNSKSLLKQSKSLYAGVSISIPVSPVCVSVLTFWFCLCFALVYFAESPKLSRFHLCCLLFNFDWHLMIWPWNHLGWKRSLSPAVNLTLPRQPLNCLPGCCGCCVCTACNRDVNHFSTWKCMKMNLMNSKYWNW